MSPERILIEFMMIIKDVKQRLIVSLRNQIADIHPHLFSDNKKKTY